MSDRILKAVITAGQNISGKIKGEQPLNAKVGRELSNYYFTKEETIILVNSTGHKIGLTLVEGRLTTTLYDANDNVLSTAYVDLEEDKDKYIVSGEYDSQTESIILTYNNGDTLSIDMSDLVSLITDHIADKNNPHRVTKEQVGLGDVQNYGQTPNTSENSNLYFTSGGAYTLKVSFNEAITDEATARVNADNALDERLDDIEEVIPNDASSSNKLATEDFVENNGGKIDSISLDGTPLAIDQNKNVDLPPYPTKQSLDIDDIENIIPDDASSSNKLATEEYVRENGSEIKEIDIEGTKVNPVQGKVNITRLALGIDQVVNTGDSDTPVSGGTEKFTTGGAYTLGQALQNNIIAVNNKLDEKVHIEDGDEISYNGDTVTKISLWKNLKTGATGSREEVIHLANGTTAGLMSYTDYLQIRNNTSRIEALEGQTKRLLYTASTNPTQQQIATFVDNYLTSIGVTPSAEAYQGIAVVVSGTYHIWHYYDTQGIGWKDDGLDTVTQFSNSSPGVIQGKQADGFVYAENDGTGSVYGWSDLKTRVTNLENESSGTTNPLLMASLKNVAYDSTNKKFTKTNNEDTTTDIITLASLKVEMELNNVDNTSDLNKPISTATQAALDEKANNDEVVKLSGDQNISGIKQFINSILVKSQYSSWDSSTTMSQSSFKIDKNDTYSTYTELSHLTLKYKIGSGTALAGKTVSLLFPINSDYLSPGTGVVSEDYYSYIATTKQISNLSTVYQAKSNKLSSIANDTNVPTDATGLLKFTNGVASLDTNTYALATALSNYQPLDNDLTAIAALTGTGLLKRTGINTWSFDNNNYITGITSSDVTTALGYTPYNSSNPNGYISGITSSMVTTALGYTPADENDIPTSYIRDITISGNILYITPATGTSYSYTPTFTDTNYYPSRSYTSGLSISTSQGIANTCALYVPYASTSQTGVITTSAQSFAGVKTFTSGVKIGSSGPTLTYDSTNECLKFTF